MTDIDRIERVSGEDQSDDPVLVAAIREVRDGNTDAFETVMARSERRIASLAWRILGDADEVRDAVQETFLRVYRFIHRYDDSRSALPWLFRITVNVCRDLERGRRKRAERFIELEQNHQAPPENQPDAVAHRNEEIELLTRAIDELPRKERLAIILRDIEGLPTEEVARILGSRPATVRVQVSSARSKIRSFLSDRRRGVES
ncbi:MAG: RNA polymerase sigma factor [Acidobacteria bacterium]|nr:RNA polymerase sigma factor [Acidobacteriota bacterium]